MFVPEEKTLSQPRRKSRVVAFAVLILVVIAAAVIYGLCGTSRLDRQLADLRSRGLPTNGEELNAWYTVPADIHDTTDLWIAATRTVANAKSDSRAQGIPIVGLGPTPVPPPGEAWAELEASRTLLKELDNEIQLIMLAADAGGMARYPIDFTAGYNAILTVQHETRTMARLLTLNAHVHAHDGKTSETFKDATAIFSVSDSLRGEPIVLSQLVRIAVHAIGCELVAEMLPRCKWTDIELHNLQIAIGQADFRSEMLTALHGELALCLNAIDGYPYPQSVFRSANKAEVIRLIATSVKGLEASWLEAVQQRQKADTELKAMSSNTFSGLIYKSMIQILPAIHLAINSGIKAEARQNCCIATIATHRYRLKHSKLPTRLTDLHDFIPNDDASKSTRLIDPVDGKPLRFKTSGAGVVIYSVGVNRADDDGDVEDDGRTSGDLGYLIAE